jgi:crotonobetainyl-CoA:carnitine CoA-transferase CaiB-like acyl-CoA transferase
MPRVPTSKALARFKVLDLTRARAGPTAARQLADWGADVVKIEMTEEGGDMASNRDGPDFQNLHRNKRSLTLDLKQPEGVEVFRRLVKTADVVVENYRPDVKFRLGIDYETLKAINPRLVYGSISGFGQDGPYRDRPGFDQIAQGMGGLMWITGLPGQGPVRVGVPIADLTAGMYLGMGIMIALLERETSGEGQWVRTSLLQAEIAMLDFQAARWLIGKEVPPQAGNDHPTGIPTGVFPTKDGHINIAASNQHMYKRLCGVLGAEELVTRPDFIDERSRSKNRAAVNAAIGEITKTKTSAEWIERMNAAGVPSGPIYKMDEMFEDPQVRHLGMAADIHHPKLGDIQILNHAVEMSRTPTKMLYATPERGEHTDEVLREAGYDDQEIAGLRGRKVV